MGSKFCNLQVHGAAPEAVEASCPGCACFARGAWISVTSPAFQWGHIQAPAKALSKQLGAAVLATEYFDDDYVEFTLYQGGKLVTRHVPAAYEDLPRRWGNAARLIETLGLNMAEEGALKKPLAVTDCEQSVHLIESFLGCPIFGVKEGAAPGDVPDRREFDSFTGGTDPVRYSKAKNPARKDRPPYLHNDEGERRQQGNVYCDTVFCYTDDRAFVVKKLRSWLKAVSGYEELASEVEKLDVQAFYLPHGIAIRGFPICNCDVGAPDLSRMFRCLTVITRVMALERGADKCRLLYCALAYGGKLLAYSCRGRDDGTNKVMPELALESPWLTLGGGELTGAFQRPDYWDAVDALSTLLGLPLYGETAMELTREEPHLRLYCQPD